MRRRLIPLALVLALPIPAAIALSGSDAPEALDDPTDVIVVTAVNLNEER